MANHSNIECEYCSGKGYFQLLLGGSETCICCKGSGEQPIGSGANR